MSRVRLGGLALATAATIAVSLVPAGGALAAQRGAQLDPGYGQGGVARLQVSLDPMLSPQAVVMHDDGVVVSTGRSLERLSPAGSLDESFGQGGAVTPPAATGSEFHIEGMAVDSHDRLVVAGTSVSAAEESTPSTPQLESQFERRPQDARVLRYLPDGTLDPTFGNGGVVETDFGLWPPSDGSGDPLFARPRVEVTGVAIDGEDRVMLTGGAAVGMASGCAHDWFFGVVTYAALVARLTESGAIDPSFGGGDGVFGGHSTGENALHAEISIDPVLGPGGELVYRRGNGHCPRQAGQQGLAELTPGGATASTFGTGGAVLGQALGWISAAAFEPSGSITALEFPGWRGGEPRRERVLRLEPNGVRDPSFGNGGQTLLTLPGGIATYLASVAPDPRGGTLLAGGLTTVKTHHDRNGRTHKRHRTWFLLMRLRANGKLDSRLGPHARIATPIRFLWGESALLIDRQGRALIVGAYRHREGSGEGVAVARYILGSAGS